MSWEVGADEVYRVESAGLIVGADLDSACAVCGAPAQTTYEHAEVSPGVFVSTVTARECSADPTHEGGAITGQTATT